MYTNHTEEGDSLKDELKGFLLATLDMLKHDEVERVIEIIEELLGKADK